MQYVGIQTQKSRNNIKSIILLLLFPILILILTYLFSYGYTYLMYPPETLDQSNIQTKEHFLHILPYVIIAILAWFIIAYNTHTKIINAATGAHPLARKDNKRIYNLVENLCISQGMKTPKINIIPDNSLNAYASGINNKTYTISLSQGIIDKLDDDELEAVIAHELTHIRNNDVRLLIISIVFVGIFAMLSQTTLNMIRMRPIQTTNNKKDQSKIIVIILLIAIISTIGYLLSMIMRFAISRKREYLADAGAAEITKNPQALANALRKIATDPNIEAVKHEDIAQLFIEHPGKQAARPLKTINNLFATHPPIQKRIQILEQF